MAEGVEQLDGSLVQMSFVNGGRRPARAQDAQDLVTARVELEGTALEIPFDTGVVYSGTPGERPPC